MPKEIILVGIEAEKIEPGLELSKKVKDLLPNIIEVVFNLIRS